MKNISTLSNKLTDEQRYEYLETKVQDHKREFVNELYYRNRYNCSESDLKEINEEAIRIASKQCASGQQFLVKNNFSLVFGSLIQLKKISNNQQEIFDEKIKSISEEYDNFHHDSAAYKIYKKYETQLKKLFTVFKSQRPSLKNKIKSKRINKCGGKCYNFAQFKNYSAYSFSDKQQIKFRELSKLKKKNSSNLKIIIEDFTRILFYLDKQNVQSKQFSRRHQKYLIYELQAQNFIKQYENTMKKNPQSRQHIALDQEQQSVSIQVKSEHISIQNDPLDIHQEKEQIDMQQFGTFTNQRSITQIYDRKKTKQDFYSNL